MCASPAPQELTLPTFVSAATASEQQTVKIGPGMLSLLDTVVAAETCEEVRPFADPVSHESPGTRSSLRPADARTPPRHTKLFTPSSPHIVLALNGAEIIF